MKPNITLILLFIMHCYVPNYAQLSISEVEAFYGSRINAITGYEQTADTSVIFITTEKTNTAFFTKISTAGMPSFQPFQVVPALNNLAGYDWNIELIQTVQATGSLVFSVKGSVNGLFYSNPPYTTALPIAMADVINDFVVVDSMVFWLSENHIHWGGFDEAGIFAEKNNQQISLPSQKKVKLAVTPTSKSLYLFDLQNHSLVQSSEPITAFSPTTTFSTVSLSHIPETADWQTFKITPDGRIFLSETETGFLGYSSSKVISSSNKMKKTLEVLNLLKAFPNPVHSFVTIQFEIPKEGLAKLSVLDMNDKEVKILQFDFFEKGLYQERLSAAALPRGVYFIILKMDDYSETQKLIIAR
mgnify:CR=1 FL=1